MLGRKTYEPEELANGRKLVKEQMAAYRKLAKAADPSAAAALAAFDTTFFANMALALDRLYVHRLRGSTGKDSNPVNELELICESLMNNGGAFRGNNVIKYRPDAAVLQLEPGDQIQMSADDFQRLATAFLDELERRFV